MKIQVAKKLLSDATARMQGACSEKTMGCIGIRTHENTIELAAADRMLSIFSFAAAEIIEPGNAYVPAKFFADVVRELPEGPVNLETAETNLIVSANAGNFSIKIPLVENAAWPNRPSLEQSEQCELSSSQLGYMINAVQYCIAQDSPRTYGTVGYLHQPEDVPDTLRLVGTDGFRLAFAEIAFKGNGAKISEGVCLSKRALGEMMRMCHEGYEAVQIAVSADGTTLLAQVPDYQIFVRLSSVRYPQYRGVLPKGELSQLVLSKTYLHAVIRRVLLASDKKTRALQLSFSESSLTLSSKTIGSSEGKESIPLDGYNGPDLRLSINGRYLTDILSIAHCDHLSLQLKGEGEPFVIVPVEEPEGCHSRHVLVPIKESV